MKKILIAALTITTLMFISCSGKNQTKDNEVLFQINPLDALMQGYYDSTTSVSEFKKHGDFGLGTFNGVNGELIELDGKVYQALYDGSVVLADDNENIPFAVTTHFKADAAAEYKNIQSLQDISDEIMSYINQHNPNSLFAIKIHGQFDSIKVRSELPQKKPYKNLAEALKTDQREFIYTDLPGTLVIMYNPRFMGQINTYGLHFHFISDDKSKGGHVLALSSKQLSAEFDKLSKLELKITDDEEFNQLNFSKDMKEVTKYAEFNK